MLTRSLGCPPTTPAPVFTSLYNQPGDTSILTALFSPPPPRQGYSRRGSEGLNRPNRARPPRRPTNLLSGGAVPWQPLTPRSPPPSPASSAPSARGRREEAAAATHHPRSSGRMLRRLGAATAAAGPGPPPCRCRSIAGFALGRTGPGRPPRLLSPAAERRSATDAVSGAGAGYGVSLCPSSPPPTPPPPGPDPRGAGEGGGGVVGCVCEGGGLVP